MGSGFRRALIAAVFALFSQPLWAQTGASLSGKVTLDTGDPMGGAAVALEELKREVRTGEDGTYRFDNVPPGSYHVSVRAEGYSTRRTEVTVTDQGATLDLVVELDLHFAEVVSVSPTARSQFESYQPTSVLAGQDLQKQLEATIGATLAVRAGRGDARARSRAGASGDSRPRRRPGRGAAGRPAGRRSVEPVGRSRRDAQSFVGQAHRGGARARRRCSTAPTRSAASSTSSPIRFPTAPVTRANGEFTLDAGVECRRGGRRRRRALRQRAAGRASRAAAAVVPATSTRRRARWRTRSRAARLQRRRARGPARTRYVGRQLRIRRLEVRRADRRGGRRSA